MHHLLEPTQQSGWVLNHDGYDILSESALELRFALGNGFLGNARRALDEPRPNLGDVARICAMGVLAALLRRRSFRCPEHGATGSRAGAGRRLVARAPCARRTVSDSARRRSPFRHSQARYAPRLAGVRLDASYSRRRHMHRA